MPKIIYQDPQIGDLDNWTRYYHDRISKIIQDNPSLGLEIESYESTRIIISKYFLFQFFILEMEDGTISLKVRSIYNKMNNRIDGITLLKMLPSGQLRSDYLINLNSLRSEYSRMDLINSLELDNIHQIIKDKIPYDTRIHCYLSGIIRKNIKYHSLRWSKLIKEFLYTHDEISSSALKYCDKDFEYSLVRYNLYSCNNQQLRELFKRYRCITEMLVKVCTDGSLAMKSHPDRLLIGRDVSPESLLFEHLSVRSNTDKQFIRSSLILVNNSHTSLPPIVTSESLITKRYLKYLRTLSPRVIRRSRIDISVIPSYIIDMMNKGFTNELLPRTTREFNLIYTLGILLHNPPPEFKDVVTPCSVIKDNLVKNLNKEINRLLRRSGLSARDFDTYLEDIIDLKPVVPIDILLKMNLSRLFKSSIYYHNHLNEIRDTINNLQDPSGDHPTRWYDLSSYIGLDKLDGIQVEFISSDERLDEESEIMNHCVFTYKSKCHTGSSFIFHIESDDGELATLEVSTPRSLYIDLTDPFEILQLRGIKNRSPSSQIKIIANRVIDLFKNLTDEKIQRLMDKYSEDYQRHGSSNLNPKMKNRLVQIHPGLIGR